MKTEAASMLLNQGSLGLTSVAVLSLLYLLVLYSIGRLGRGLTASHPLAPWVFSFALAVYCTSWAFYGVTAQAALNGWWIPPTYIGTLLLFWFGFGLLSRIAVLCRRLRITSMADLIATRFGHSRLLAVLTTLMVLMAVIPYIALQLQAVSTSINALVARAPNHQPSAAWYQDTGFYVSLWLAVFAMLFAGKSAKAHQPNPGLMAAIAFESLVKLLALLALGSFICFGLFDGFSDIFSQASHSPAVQQMQSQAAGPAVYWVHVLLGFIATLCLPHLFHVSFVENQRLQHLRHARWLFPLYLLLMSLFTLPVALAGILVLGSPANVDLVMLQLPLSAQRTDMALLAYLGGFSAATSMVTVATVVLGIMITNELLTPLIYRQQQKPADGKPLIRMVTLRRAAMLTVLTLGYLYYRLAGTDAGLAELGLLAFALIAQLAPALLLGLIDPKVNRQGALAGLGCGAMLWALLLLTPTLVKAGAVSWPQALAALFQQPDWSAEFWHTSPLQLDRFSLGVLISLSINLLMVLLISRWLPTRLSEALDSARFFHRPATNQHDVAPSLLVQDCYLLVRRFAGEREARLLLQRYLKTTEPPAGMPAPAALQHGTERMLAAVVGGVSMRLLLNAARQQSRLALDSVARFVDQASQLYQFNQALLSATIDNIGMGISVVDAELRLIAWNQRYLQMFSYPDGLIEVGRPVAEIIRFNASRGWFFQDESPSTQQIEQEVSKRLQYLRHGSSYRFQRRQRDGRVFEMQGNPLPGGGFVTTYSDVSSFIEVQRQLEASNNTLEQRVSARTAELEQLNQQLASAKLQLEEQTISKNRFFAAASHDLLQPFNAAALFCGLIRDKANDGQIQQWSRDLAASLNAAEELLTGILELTKLDSGVIHAQCSPVPLHELLQQLSRETRLLAGNKQLKFCYRPTSVTVHTDARLLRRVVQNLLSNAIRYTQSGKILLGVRRVRQSDGQWLARLEVWDTGIGIPPDEQQRIFQEFQQGRSADSQGLGIGLAISQRICHLLQSPLTLRSVHGRGSCFAVTLPCVAPSQQPDPIRAPQEQTVSFAGKTVLLLDNDSQLASAVSALLRSWNCQVLVAAEPAQALHWVTQQQPIDLLLFDYHLDRGITGVEVAQQLQEHFSLTAPVLIHSADQQQQSRDQALNAGFHFMLKPLKPANLKRLLQRLLR